MEKEEIQKLQSDNEKLRTENLEYKKSIQKLFDYIEQQLRLQRTSEIKYTGEEAYFDALDVCKNTINALNKEV